MDITFDNVGEVELPYIILCNPNRDELVSLSLCYDTNLKLRFNAISEFSFRYPESIDGGETILEAFSLLQNKRLVKIEGYGYYQITNAQKSLDGSVPVMDVSCESQEIELIQKKVNSYGGTKPLYNVLSPDGTVLQDMLDLCPNWSVGTVDAELLTLYRTFDISDSNVYGFLLNDVSKAFDCIFTFDTDARTISAQTIANATTETDIYLSFDNVITKGELSEKSDEIVTALSVFGNGNLSISVVNPMGTSKMYNFDYYKSTNWMSQNLIDAIDAWEVVFDATQPLYASELLTLQGYNGELLTLESDLATFQEEYLALEGVQKARIQDGLDYSDINILLTAKQADIDSQNTLISNKETQITNVTSTLQSYNTSVSFSTNFTAGQLLELDNFIFENSYINENIIQTDSMSLSEVQDQAQALYDQALDVLAKVSTPRYEFSLDSVNYTVIPEFSVFTEQTDLGVVVTAELEDGSTIQSVILEISFSFDNPDDFSLKLSNRLRLDDGKYKYSDLMGEVVKTGSSVAFNSTKWADWNTNSKDNVTTFITSALDATTNNLISNSNQEILINENGLRARNSDGLGGYSDKQAWLVNNVLAFSDDGFQTSKLALGEISLPEGGTSYGLVADVIVGRLLAGNTLTITNEGSNFTLDSTGATLTDASFSVENTNTKILIDPSELNVMTIQKNEGGTFVDKFWVDNTGNVNFAGDLTGATGTFSGSVTATLGNIGTLVIDSDGLKTPDGVNYLRGNGDLKWGGLSISGGSAIFSGTIYADKLVGQIVDTQVASGLDAGKVTYGNMSGSRMYGGTWGGSSGSITTSGSGGIVEISGSIISLRGGGTNFIVSTNIISAGSFTMSLGTLNASNISISSNVTIQGWGGTNMTAAIETIYGVRYFRFIEGLLVSYSYS
jgi:hypothetical protein